MHLYIYPQCLSSFSGWLTVSCVWCVAWSWRCSVCVIAASNLSFQHLLYPYIIKGVTLCILAPKLLINFYYILLWVRLSVIYNEENCFLRLSALTLILGSPWEPEFNQLNIYTIFKFLPFPSWHTNLLLVGFLEAWMSFWPFPITACLWQVSV